MKRLLAILCALTLLAPMTALADHHETGATDDGKATASTDEGEAQEGEAKEGDEKDEKKESAHGSYEWKFSWGGGLEVGFFFTELSRWNLHILEPNEQPESDADFILPIELAFEVSPIEGLRATLFGGLGMTPGADPGLDIYYVGLEPAFTVRRSIWEFGAGAGVGYGGATLNVGSESPGDATLLLIRPFVEARVYPSEIMAVYARIGFNLMHVLDFESDTLQVRDEANLPGSADHLSEAGPYVGLGVRFGDYPEHVKDVPDTDGDGFRDDVDDCPSDPEDKDDFQDEDGCPDLDNDNDGIADTADGCPLDPEDLDGWKDEDGCPETDDDTDGDGILNATDGCPNDPEDLDGFQDEDGCPDLDNDNDGFPDSADDCPNEAGVAAKRGCPFRLVEVTLERIVIKDKVFFELDKSVIKDESFGLLNEVAEVIKANPQIRKIEVQGHTDHQGKPKYNLKLSQGRADAVMQYLVEQGVEAERLIAKGYGSSTPLVPLVKGQKETEEAAAANRRVEFVILEQDEVTKTLREDQAPEAVPPQP